MKSITIRQLDNGRLMVIIRKDGKRQNFLCDWIRDTLSSLELIRWSREPEGNIRQDEYGNNIRTVIKTLIKKGNHIQGAEYITKI